MIVDEQWLLRRLRQLREPIDEHRYGVQSARPGHAMSAATRGRLPPAATGLLGEHLDVAGEQCIGPSRSTGPWAQPWTRCGGQARRTLEPFEKCASLPPRSSPLHRSQTRSEPGNRVCARRADGLARLFLRSFSDRDRRRCCRAHSLPRPCSGTTVLPQFSRLHCNCAARAVRRPQALGPAAHRCGLHTCGHRVVSAATDNSVCRGRARGRVGIRVRLRGGDDFRRRDVRLGRRLDRSLVRRLAGRRLGQVSRFLYHRGTLAIAAVRLVPIGAVCGDQCRCRCHGRSRRAFLAGTAFGLLPGTLVATLFGDELPGVA